MIDSKPDFPSTKTIHNLQSVQDQIVNAVLIVGSLTGILSMITLFVTSPESRMIDATSWLVILTITWSFLAVLRNHIPYSYKAIFVTATIYSGGLANMLGWGLLGSSNILFILMVLMAITLLGNRAGFISFVLVVVTVSGMTFLVRYQRINFEIDFASYAVSDSAWLSSLIMIVLVSAMIVASVTRVISVLREQLDQFRQRSEELSSRTQELSGEMQLRQTAEISLEGAMAELQALDRMKDTFLDSVSHELRTPIANIHLYLQLLGMKPEKHEEYLAILKKENERLRHIVEQMLYASSDVHDLALTTMVDIDLNVLVKSLFRVHEERLQESGICLVLPDDEGQYLVLAAIEHIDRVLSNLIDNAVKYTPDAGDIRVSLSRYEGEKGEKPQIAVHIENTGDCISEQEKKTIFQRFVRGESSLKKGIPGAGLGLPIARQIVGKYQGRIEVSCDEVAQRIQFSMWLPSVVPMAELIADQNIAPVPSH